jgi:hypothetical protein
VKKYIPLLLIIAVFILLPQFADAQCSMCRKVASDGANKTTGANVSQNLNSAILYLMAVPYFSLLFIFRKQIAGLYRQWKNSKKMA